MDVEDVMTSEVDEITAYDAITDIEFVDPDIQTEAVEETPPLDYLLDYEEYEEWFSATEEYEDNSTGGEKNIQSSITELGENIKDFVSANKQQTALMSCIILVIVILVIVKIVKSKRKLGDD